LLELLDDRTLLSLLLVSNTGDDGPGTLRAAIERADLHPGSIIAFRVTGAITLSSALPDLSADVTIAGPGAPALTVERSSSAGMPQFGIFTVDAGVTASISNLVIADGDAADGGGIFNAGTLTVSSCVLTGDSAVHGGGVFNAGTLTTNDCTFTSDSAAFISGDAAAPDDAAAELAVATSDEAGAELEHEAKVAPGSPAFLAALGAEVEAGANPAIYIGGAIASLGTLTVSNSIFSENSAITGGAIANYGSSTVDDSTLSENSARFGGSIGSTGDLTLVNSTVSGNSAEFGGGIADAGTLTVSNSNISRNSASGLGGGGIDNLGNLTLNSSTVVGNSAPLDGNSQGGGIVNFGKAIVTNSIFSGNVADLNGSIANAGTLTLNDSGILGNSPTSGNGVAGPGTATVGNNTFSAGSGYLASVPGGLLNNAATTVIPQSTSSSVSVSFAATGSNVASANSGSAPASPAAPPTTFDLSFMSLTQPPAETDAIASHPGAAAADMARAMPASDAPSATMVALDTAAGTSDVRSVPLRESTLALVRTLLPVSLETRTATNEATQHASPLEIGDVILLGPGSPMEMRQDSPAPYGSSRSNGSAAASGSAIGSTAKPVPRRATPWEQFFIGLDRNFDQVRRTFLEPPGDHDEPKPDNGEGPSAWDHLRATDEAIASGWSEDADDLNQLPDLEGTPPVRVACSAVAVALALGCARLRRWRPPRARLNPTLIAI
jgi:hypothetical protein